MIICTSCKEELDPFDFPTIRFKKNAYVSKICTDCAMARFRHLEMLNSIYQNQPPAPTVASEKDLEIINNIPFMDDSYEDF